MKIQVEGYVKSLFVDIPDMPFDDPMVPVLAFREALKERGGLILFAHIEPVLEGDAAWYRRWAYNDPKQAGKLVHFWECHP